MLSKKIKSALNDQMTFELQAWYTYRAIAAWFKTQNLEGFAAWMETHATEELQHAQKFYDYLYERLEAAEYGELAKPKVEYKDPMEAVQDAMRHEKMVTERIHDLVELAREEKDHATDVFLQWFVQEQVEEESVVDELIQRLELIADFKPGLFMLDRDLLAKGGQH